jgi:hypothetical protein
LYPAIASAIICIMANPWFVVESYLRREPADARSSDVKTS